MEPQIDAVNCEAREYPLGDTNEHEYGGISKALYLLVLISVNSWFLLPFAHAEEEITVAVASSLYVTMQQKAYAFEKEHDVTIRLVSGSTGRLYNQIMQGAPFDMFIAADADRPALLAQQGRAIEQFSVAYGYVGIMIGKETLKDLTVLKSPTIRHIVIANPDVAPFGRASREVLIQQGLWSVLKPKFVYAQNAMQAAMMVDKGLVDAGFIPVASNQTAIAEIEYRGVLLNDSAMAHQWLKSIATAPMQQLVLR